MYRHPRDQFVYELNDWENRMGGKAVRTLAHEDISPAWAMCQAHVFELDNGQFALVTEEGCSCYESSAAQIDLHPTAEKALAAFMHWVKENKG